MADTKVDPSIFQIEARLMKPFDEWLSITTCGHQ